METVVMKTNTQAAPMPQAPPPTTTVATSGPALDKVGIESVSLEQTGDLLFNGVLDSECIELRTFPVGSGGGHAQTAYAQSKVEFSELVKEASIQGVSVYAGLNP